MLTSYISAAVASRLPAAFPAETVPNDPGQGGGTTGGGIDDLDQGISGLEKFGISTGTVLLVIAVAIAFVGVKGGLGISNDNQSGDLGKAARRGGVWLIGMAVVVLALGGAGAAILVTSVNSAQG